LALFGLENFFNLFHYMQGEVLNSPCCTIAVDKENAVRED